MNTHQLVEWQIWDHSVDACFPWFTHPMLEVLKTWDLKDKRILEFGGGKSTKWWRQKAKWVTTIDTNSGWVSKISEECLGLDNGVLLLAPINEGDQEFDNIYCNAGDAYGPYDIVIVDGILRNSCLEKALSMQKPLIVIADNWYQSYVWLSNAAVELMKPHPINVFEQENHTNNDGINKWKTVYWELK